MRDVKFKRLVVVLAVAVVAMVVWACTPDNNAANTNGDKDKTLYGNVVDVVSKRVFPGKVVVRDGKIANIEEIKAEECKEQQYILPGFVDSHIHIESTLMTPYNYGRMAVAKGVIAAVCDPHEIANVLGVEGIEFMIADGKGVRFNFNYTVPSCVPSTQFETAGAVIDAQDVAALIGRDEVVALAEVMNVPGVVYEDADIMAKLQAAKLARKPIDGHAPQYSGEHLRKYIESGISTDHECVSLDEAEEKLSLGMKIIIREGSAACNFEALYSLIAKYPGKTLFCSDDMYPDDMEEIGYINGMVKRAIAKGMPLWETLECAAVTPVRHYGLKNGLLQEGDKADFIVVDNLTEFNILATYIEGEEVYNATQGVVDEAFILAVNGGADNLNKFEASEIMPEAMQVKWEDKELKVIVATEGSLLTGMEYVRPMKDAEGNVVTPVEAGVAKIVVYNRYTEAAPQIAYIKGFTLNDGALASTIAHDSHNIIAVGSNDVDLAAAINRLIEERGGLVVCNGEQMETLSLPVAGLMTTLQPQTVAQKHIALKQLAAQLGCRINAPFMTLSFMALPVIPDLKLTDKGLFDGVEFNFTSIWKD